MTITFSNGRQIEMSISEFQEFVTMVQEMRAQPAVQQAYSGSGIQYPAYITNPRKNEVTC